MGESNILRFLSRLSSTHLNYELGENPHEIDALLDVSHALLKATTKSERAGLLQTVNKSLGKSNWLAGRDQVGVADLAVFSAIKQVTAANEINVNLSKWLQRCEASL